MTLREINISETIKEARQALVREKGLPPSVVALINLLIVIIDALAAIFTGGLSAVLSKILDSG